MRVQWQSASTHKWRILTVAVLCASLLLFIAPAFHMAQQRVFILATSHTQKFEYGIVFGSGVNQQGEPYDELRARLNTAADDVQRGAVDKLILSGDNRFENYNEPTAMKRYLISERGLNPDILQEDFAGRSTYESCERARKIFSIERAVLYTAGSHLPRAIFTCRHFGIESYGVSSGVEASNASRREPLAIIKMYFNLYVLGEPTVLGEPINF